jgi:hypothetical protein
MKYHIETLEKSCTAGDSARIVTERDSRRRVWGLPAANGI